MLFKQWPKIPRLENEVYHITEKIDGNNACIIITENHEFSSLPICTPVIDNKRYGIWAQSRTRLITPEDDNFGFAKWVQDNAEQLIKDLGVGYHFGEWWGQGIRRGYGLDHKRFSLFNPTKKSDNCHHVPYLAESSAQDLSYWLEETKSWLTSTGSHAAPNYMKPEGLIIYAEKAKAYWKVLIDK